MFERYTEKARRVIFFARYEASQFGSPCIETEHLLLGLLREDKALAARFLRSSTSVESIRKQIEAHTTMRETNAPPAGGCPEESTASSNSSGCPHVPAIELTAVARLVITPAGWESAATRNLVAAGLRGMKRTAPRRLAFQLPALPGLKPLRYSLRLARAKNGLGS